MILSPTTGELVWAGSEWGLKDGMQDNSPTITGGKYYPGGLKLECDKDGNPLKQRWVTLSLLQPEVLDSMVV